MKKNLFLLLCFSYTFSFSQNKEPTYPVVNGKACFEGVVAVDSVKTEELYKRCKIWFAKTYKSAQNVLQMDSRDEIIGRGAEPFYVFSVATTAQVYVNYALSVKFKDGKYKYSLTDFVVSTGFPIEDFIRDSETFKENGKAKRLNMDYRKEMLRFSSSLLASLEKGMKTATDEW